MEVPVVDCEAPTVEKKQLVDTQAPTVEKNNMVNPAQTTKLKPSCLVLNYKISDPNSKIIPFLPKELIQKSNKEPLKFGRTEHFDVFLNDECMSRNYAHINADENDPSQFEVVNFSTSKLIIVDNKELWNKDRCYIRDKSVLQLDIITFSVSLQCGDKNAEFYIVRVQPEAEQKQQFYRSPSFQMQNFGNCNLTCCHVPVPIHIPNTSLQIHNSSHWPQVPAHNHNSSHWPQVPAHNHNCSHWPQVSPNNHNSSHWPQVPAHNHNSSHWPQVPAHNHNSSHIPQKSPNNHNSSNVKPVFVPLTKDQSAYWDPDKKGSNRRQPQEHAMPSESAFLEKQQQYQFIEDMAKKPSI